MKDIVSKFDYEKHVDNSKYKKAMLFLIIAGAGSLYFLPQLFLVVLIVFFFMIYGAIDTNKIMDEK